MSTARLPPEQSRMIEAGEAADAGHQVQVSGPARLGQEPRSRFSSCAVLWMSGRTRGGAGRGCCDDGSRREHGRSTPAIAGHLRRSPSCGQDLDLCDDHGRRPRSLGRVRLRPERQRMRMQRFRWAVVAAVGLTAVASVMAGVTAPGDRSGGAVRTPRMPSTAAARATVALAAVEAGPGQATTRRAKSGGTAARSAAWWRTRIAVVNCTNLRQAAPKRLMLSCATRTRPPGNYVTGLRWLQWSRRQGSARGVGDVA